MTIFDCTTIMILLMLSLLIFLAILGLALKEVMYHIYFVVKLFNFLRLT